MCTWIYFVEINYSQLKTNHLNNMPSTKAARGGISVVCLTRMSRYQGHEAELMATSSSNIGKLVVSAASGVGLNSPASKDNVAH
jgi:hypothetical protein